MSPITSHIDHRVTVFLPDLFKGFLVDKPLQNANYHSAREESEKWLQRTMSLSSEQARKVNYCDFTYLCSLLVPDASHERLKVISDWGNWVFVFDDMFDEGELSHDPVTSRRVMNNLLSKFLPDRERSSDEPVVDAHDCIYERLVEGSSSSTVQRYVETMTMYCGGALQHVDDHVADHVAEIPEMLEVRRQSSGVFPTYALIEYACGLDIPDEVFQHEAIQALEKLGAEFVVLMNDILSYQKEERDNFPFNTVAVYRISGSSAQEAFNQVAALVDARFAQWEEAVRAVPSWGDRIDAQVRQYIRGIQNIVQANLSWSFRTGRYFGLRADYVRETRELDVLTEPSFLSDKRISASV